MHPDFSHLFPTDIRPSIGDSLGNQPPLASGYRLFKGDPQHPFLAPRGVFISDEWLFVADTGQNRVFGWQGVPENEFESPTLVLGQTDAAHTDRNAGAAVSATSLQYPSGIWTDNERLIVADAWNHRVLIWHTMPTTHGQPADVVLGQPDFEHNEPNVGGIGSEPTAQTLNWPYGVFSDGQQLWVADTGNRRVLYYKSIPTQNFAAADGVIGKPNFEERDFENQDAVWPYSVKVSESGAMCIADTQFYRQLVWLNWEDAFIKSADVIIGQPDFESSGQNQFRLHPIQSGLNWNYDSFFYRNGLFVADTGNSRLLWFKELPNSHAQPADNVLGHAHFEVGSENPNTRFGTDKQLYWPFSICINATTLAVADTGNHRILLYQLTV